MDEVYFEQHAWAIEQKCLFVHFTTDSFLNSFSKYQLNLSLQDQVIVLELYTDKLRDLARVYHTITGCCSWLHWFIFFCLRLKHTVYGADHLEHHNRHHTCCVWIWCKEVHQSQQCAFIWTSWRGNAWGWIWGWKMTFFYKYLNSFEIFLSEPPETIWRSENAFHDPFKPIECLSSYTASVIRCEDCLCASQLKLRVLRVHIILSEKERRMMLGETWALSQQMSQLGTLCCVSCWWGVTALWWECALNEAQLSAHVPIWP